MPWPRPTTCPSTGCWAGRFMKRRTELVGRRHARKDWVLECQEAVSKGYTSFKAKARPWFDLFDQVDVLTPTLRSISHRLRFQLMLLDAGTLRSISQSSNDSPTSQSMRRPSRRGDVRSYQLLRRTTRIGAIHLATHRSRPPSTRRSVTVS
jgi:hypothetical protein